MNELLQSVEELRRMSTAELTRLGEDSLTRRLIEQALEARQKHGILGPGNIEAFLNDPDCVRYPTRLVLEYGEMGMHQFAQPEADYNNMEAGGRMLYIRPVLGKRPDMLAQAIAYMIPVINYGKMVTDENCLDYGSTLLDLSREDYYGKVCALADFTGSEERYVETDVPKTSGCGSGGCSCH